MGRGEGQGGVGWEVGWKSEAPEKCAACFLEWNGIEIQSTLDSLGQKLLFSRQHFVQHNQDMLPVSMAVSCRKTQIHICVFSSIKSQGKVRF